MNHIVCDRGLLRSAADNIEDCVFGLTRKAPADLPHGLVESDDPAMLGLMAERSLRAFLGASEWMEQAEESGLRPAGAEVVQEAMEKLDAWTKQMSAEGAISEEAQAANVVGRELTRLRLLCIRLRMENNWLKVSSPGE